MTGLAELFAYSFPLLVIGMIIGIIALAIFLDYKKKMAMVIKGLMPKEEKHIPEDRLGWGIAILGIGISLIISWIFNLDNRVVVGLIFISIGISLLISYMNLCKINN